MSRLTPTVEAKTGRPKNMNVVRVSSYEEHHDDFPTPPWATRALFKYVLEPGAGVEMGSVVLEPACGRGHMVKVLREAGLDVLAYDKFRYDRYHKIMDYTTGPMVGHYDFMITNPPYKQANQFVQRALGEAREGVAVLLRTIWLESVTRYEELFKNRPPTTVAVFSRRMPAAHGRLVRGGGAMMSHSWFWWDLRRPATETRLMWIPPQAQSELERDEDYV